LFGGNHHNTNTYLTNSLHLIISSDIRITMVREPRQHCIRNSVRFAQVDDLIEYADGRIAELTLSMKKDIWWRPHEFQELRKAARDLVDEAIQKGLGVFIGRAYVHHDENAQHALNVWAKCKDTRRGLERFICSDYAVLRLQKRKNLIETVLYTQYQLNQEVCYDAERASNIIAKVAKALSSGPILYAEMLGKADACSTSRQKVMHPQQTLSDSSDPLYVQPQRQAGSDSDDHPSYIHPSPLSHHKMIDKEAVKRMQTHVMYLNGNNHCKAER
jgi:hypothetical protein